MLVFMISLILFQLYSSNVLKAAEERKKLEVLGKCLRPLTHLSSSQLQWDTLNAIISFAFWFSRIRLIWCFGKATGGRSWCV